MKTSQSKCRVSVLCRPQIAVQGIRGRREKKGMMLNGKLSENFSVCVSRKLCHDCFVQERIRTGG